MTSKEYFMALESILMVGSVCIGIGIGYLISYGTKGLWRIIEKIMMIHYRNELMKDVVNKMRDKTYDKWY